MNLIYVIVTFFVGAVFGSFANVCIYRIPLEKSIIFPRSHCPFCKSLIKFYDNIPILSYLILRGKCRSCNGKISIKYLLVEVLCGIIFVALFLKYGFTSNFFIYSLLMTALIIISFIDIKYRIIPNVITIPGIPLGIFLSFFLNNISVLSSLIGVILAILILGIVTYGYYLFTGLEGMGMGDIKLLAMLGAFLGWKSVLFIIFFSSFIGTLIGLLLIFILKKGRKYPIPFGPFLSLAGILYPFLGDRLIILFLNLT